MKTIKQIADSLGIEKQRVYRYIKRNHISEAHHDAGVMYFSDVVESLVAEHFTNTDHITNRITEAHQTTSLDVVVSMLQKELDIKNEQIRDLNARLAETTTALLSAQQSAQAEQILHAGTIQKQLNDGGGSPAEPDALTINVGRRLKFLFTGKLS